MSITEGLGKVGHAAAAHGQRSLRERAGRDLCSTAPNAVLNTAAQQSKNNKASTTAAAPSMLTTRQVAAMLKKQQQAMQIQVQAQMQAKMQEFAAHVPNPGAKASEQHAAAQNAGKHALVRARDPACLSSARNSERGSARGSAEGEPWTALYAHRRQKARRGVGKESCGGRSTHSSSSNSTSVSARQRKRRLHALRASQITVLELECNQDASVSHARRRRSQSTTDIICLLFVAVKLVVHQEPQLRHRLILSYLVSACNIRSAEQSTSRVCAKPARVDAQSVSALDATRRSTISEALSCLVLNSDRGSLVRLKLVPDNAGQTQALYAIKTEW
eukprot:6202359-Pleurochrysis_carterae.AAC.1